MKREEAITNVLNGLAALNLLYIHPFSVKCEGGACWSRDTIYVEKGEMVESSQKWMSDNIHKALHQPTLEDIQKDPFYRTAPLTTGQHFFIVEFVETLPTKKYFSL